MKTYKQRLNINKIIYIFLALFFISVIIFNLSVVIKRIIDANNTKNEIDDIQKIIHIQEIQDVQVEEAQPPLSTHENHDSPIKPNEEQPQVTFQNDNLSIKPNEEQPQLATDENKTLPIKPNNDYWNYIDLPLININLEDLKDINSDTVAFINISGTNINYPVVQTKDNKYYLNHSFKKGENGAGWLFMDYRNDVESFAENTIIYGHSSLDKTMFGSLSRVLNNSWMDNKENGIIRLATSKESTIWEIFSVYTIPAENYYIKTDFENLEEYKEWSETIYQRSKYSLNKTFNESDKILTLSTCYENEGDIRLVVHAKLIKSS